MPAIRDMEYAAVVGRERPLIQATAYLLTGDPVQAERVVQLVFARLYERRHGMRDSRLEAIRTLVQTAHAPVHLPWEQIERFELIDGPPPSPFAEPVVTDLRMLSYEQRVAVILACYAGLSTAQIAEVLNQPADEVLSLAEQGRNLLAAGHLGRTNDQTLAEELKAAIPYDLREFGGDTDDLAHGRQLARRHWIQRSSVALVAVALIIAAAAIFISGRPPVPQAAPVVPMPTASRQTCETSDVTCRAHIAFKWRAMMAEVAWSHLDPTGKYFSDFGFWHSSRYDTAGFWTGQGGALALRMFRLDLGATEVYLQIATDRKFAVRCGATTHQKCIFIRLMDGNSYLMTDSTLADSGIEVQYSPNGDEVITVIARNADRGQSFEISRGDLIKLVQDERLHLPKLCCYRR
jgi:DNA-directed RNA polymerase specialized sigma24 family protein